VSHTVARILDDDQRAAFKLGCPFRDNLIEFGSDRCGCLVVQPEYHDAWRIEKAERQ
jgi:hypothetical protein